MRASFIKWYHLLRRHYNDDTLAGAGDGDGEEEEGDNDSRLYFIHILVEMNENWLDTSLISRWCCEMLRVPWLTLSVPSSWAHTLLTCTSTGPISTAPWESMRKQSSTTPKVGIIEQGSVAVHDTASRPGSFVCELKFHNKIQGSFYFMYAPSQWEMALRCNAISHWLGTYTKWSLKIAFCELYK